MEENEAVVAMQEAVADLVSRYENVLALTTEEDFLYLNVAIFAEISQNLTESAQFALLVGDEGASRAYAAAGYALALVIQTAAQKVLAERN